MTFIKFGSAPEYNRKPKDKEDCGCSQTDVGAPYTNGVSPSRIGEDQPGFFSNPVNWLALGTMGIVGYFILKKPSSQRGESPALGHAKAYLKMAGKAREVSDKEKIDRAFAKLKK
jgi:hypothetical protein